MDTKNTVPRLRPSSRRNYRLDVLLFLMLTLLLLVVVGLSGASG